MSETNREHIQFTGEMAELAEGARLLSVYGLIAHPGFESLSLRHEKPGSKDPGFFILKQLLLWMWQIGGNLCQKN